MLKRTVTCIGVWGRGLGDWQLIGPELGTPQFREIKSTQVRSGPGRVRPDQVKASQISIELPYVHTTTPHDFL